MKKLFASVLCLVLLLALLPVTALAADAGWSFDAATGTLTVTDNVIMGDLKPWNDVKDSVKKVVYVQSKDGSFFRFTEIPQFAFMGYPALEEVVIPEGVKTIGSQAFENCTSLKTVYISADVMDIGSSAFKGCTALENVVFSTDEPTFEWDRGMYVGYNAFQDCTSLKTIALPDNCSILRMEAFKGCTALETISFPKSLIYIDFGAFEGCTALKTIRYAGTEADWEKINNSPGMDNRDLIAHLVPLVKYAAAPLVSFSDVAADAYYYGPVMWAVEQEITGGIGNNMFGPDNGCTRGQVVTFLWAAAGRPEPETKANPFADVFEYDYYYKAVLWAVENGITGGVGEGLFGPAQECTRGQIVTFLWASQGKPAAEGDMSFTDVTDTDWFAQPVLWAVQNEVTGGIGNNMFGPNNTCTRGQVVTFLYKVYGNT